MANIFNELISGHGFERHYNRHFTGLSEEGIDVRYVYSQPDTNPFVRIDMDNRQVMSRISLWESGHCDVDVVSFRDGSSMIKDSFEYTSLEEFEAKLLEFIELMRETRNPH